MNAREELTKIASILAHCKGLPSDNPEDWDWCATTPKVERARILAMAEQSREWSRTLSVWLSDAADRITPAMSQSAAGAWAACEARDLNHRQAGIYLHMLAKPWAGALRIKRIWQHLGLDPGDMTDIIDVLEAFGCRGAHHQLWFAPRVDPAERKEGAEAMATPLAIRAGDERVLVNGRPLPVDFRILSEENYVALANTGTERTPDDALEGTCQAIRAKRNAGDAVAKIQTEKEAR